MVFTEYLTKEGERWDWIAWTTLGSPYAYEVIIRANPQYRDLLKLPAGVRLLIPVEEVVTPTQTVTLPPWRR